MSKMKLYNSPDSIAAIDAQVTEFGCIGSVNGVLTVCQAYSNIVPNHYVEFDSASGLHVQTHPNADPTAVYDWQEGSFQILATADEIQLLNWSDSDAVAKGEEAPIRVEPGTSIVNGRPAPQK